MADEVSAWEGRMRRWLARYGLLLVFGIDLLMFVAAILLWKPGTRPIASALFVFALLPPLALLVTLVDPFEE